MTYKKNKPLKIKCLSLKTTSCFTCVVWGRCVCQLHDIVAAKLNAYGSETSAVRLIFDYFTNKKQQTKPDCHYSTELQPDGQLVNKTYSFQSSTKISFKVSAIQHQSLKSIFFWQEVQTATLRKKCPYSELFWSVFSCIRTEYGEMLCISPHSFQIRKNKDLNNSEYGHFLRNVQEIIIQLKPMEKI